MYILFCRKNQKNVSQKEVKDLTYEVSVYIYIKQANQCKGNLSTHFKSSRSQMFFGIGVPKNFAISTGKQLRFQLYEIETPTQLFSCEYCKILRTAFL